MKRRTRGGVAMAGMAIVAVAAASSAMAATQQTYSQKFTVTKAGSATGSLFSASARDPQAVNQQPSPARQVTLTFPSGTKVNTKAVPACSASDTQLAQLGPAACPAKTKVGSGSGKVITPLVTLPLVDAKVTAFNRKGGMILLVQPTVSNPVILRPTLAGGKLKISVPQVCLVGTGPDCGEAVLADFTLSLKKITSKKTGTYLTTPRKCPAGGWVFKSAFTFKDGTTQALESKQACKK